MQVCEKKFKAETNCDTTPEWEPAAKIAPAVPAALRYPAVNNNAAGSARTSTPGATLNNSYNQGRTFQFHPLVPKEHIKAANTIIAASVKPTRPRAGNVNSYGNKIGGAAHASQSKFPTF
jgi:hypothetical protein